uniref:Uncharacterized protein n=1 Tax=Parascaris equorum TaxID=6256 RepID=A0A914RNQ7_PAREQ
MSAALHANVQEKIRISKSVAGQLQEAVLEERRKSDFLRQELNEAQRRVSELTLLVANFSSDARNSRHDATDLLCNMLGNLCNKSRLHP